MNKVFWFWLGTWSKKITKIATFPSQRGTWQSWKEKQTYIRKIPKTQGISSFSPTPTLQERRSNAGAQGQLPQIRRWLQCVSIVPCHPQRLSLPRSVVDKNKTTHTTKEPPNMQELNYGLIQFKIVQRVQVIKSKLVTIYPSIDPTCTGTYAPVTPVQMFRPCPNPRTFWLAIFNSLKWGFQYSYWSTSFDGLIWWKTWGLWMAVKDEQCWCLFLAHCKILLN